NDDWNPIAGIYGYVSEELMGGVLPGDIDAYRFIGDVRKFVPITANATMAVHLRSGYVQEFGGTEEVPFAERFFTGGAFSVRGYGEQQLGPKRPSGDPLGARILGLGSTEFRFQLPFVDGVMIPGIKLDLSPFWGGLFFDAGNVWNSVKELQKESLRYGAGIGLRYNTPVGPLRLDYAREIAVDDSRGKYGVFYIAFGNAF
ncbi:MAG: outer membrane protein assembly factor, partial [bacterium]|nr:outer membrane protein assembly factor [bacterium]